MFKKNPDDSWVSGKVKHIFKGRTRSYVIEDDQGRSYERNRVHIMPSKNIPYNFQVDEKEVDEEQVVKEWISTYMTMSGRMVRNPRRLNYNYFKN